MGIICDIWKTKAELKKLETKVTQKDRRIELEPVPGNQGAIHVDRNQLVEEGSRKWIDTL